MTNARTFDTTGTTLTRVGKVLTITCDNDKIADRVADQLRTEVIPGVAQGALNKYQALEIARRVNPYLGHSWSFSDDDLLCYYAGFNLSAFARELLGARCSGSTSVSKTEGDGSIPSASANSVQCSSAETSGQEG